MNRCFILIGMKVSPQKKKRSILDTWFTDRINHILNSFGLSRFSTGSNPQFSNGELFYVFKRDSR